MSGVSLGKRGKRLYKQSLRADVHKNLVLGMLVLDSINC